MTGEIVVVLVAGVVMLLAAVAVSVVRLRTALRALRDAGDSSTMGRVRPIVDELTEASQVTSLEFAQLQSSIERLRAGRRDD